MSRCYPFHCHVQSLKCLVRRVIVPSHISSQWRVHHGAVSIFSCSIDLVACVRRVTLPSSLCRVYSAPRRMHRVTVPNPHYRVEPLKWRRVMVLSPLRRVQSLKWCLRHVMSSCHVMSGQVMSCHCFIPTWPCSIFSVRVQSCKCHERLPTMWQIFQVTSCHVVSL